jgi:hypothetical protein
VAIDQPGLLEHAEMVRDQVQGRRDEFGQLLRRAIAQGERIDDRETTSIRKCGVRADAVVELHDL